MAKQSKLDPYADEIIQWRVEGKDYRQITALLGEKGIDVTFPTVSRWYRKQASLVTQQQARVALQIQVTRELIETEWAKQIHEFYGNYALAKEQGQHAEEEYQRAVDENDAAAQERWDLERHTGPAMAVWGRLWVDAVKAVAAKLVPSPTPVTLAAEGEGGMTAQEFWAKIRAERDEE